MNQTTPPLYDWRDCEIDQQSHTPPEHGEGHVPRTRSLFGHVSGHYHFQDPGRPLLMSDLEKNRRRFGILRFILVRSERAVLHLFN